MERSAITDLVRSMLSDKNAFVCFKTDISFIKDDEDTFVFKSSTALTGEERIYEIVDSLNEQSRHSLNEFTHFLISICTNPDYPLLMEELDVLNEELLEQIQGEDKELKWELNNRALVRSMSVLLIASRAGKAN